MKMDIVYIGMLKCINMEIMNENEFKKWKIEKKFMNEN